LVSRRCAEAIAFTPDVEPCDFFSSAPATFVEPGVKGRFLFSRPIALRLAQLNLGIARVPEDDVRRLLKVLLASSSLEVCNAKVSGKGRRYRKNWQSNQKTPECLVRFFVGAVEKAVFDIARFSQRPNLSFNLLRGDARLLIDEVGPIDLAVFSPPYPNSFDYTDVYNVELWAAGYLTAKSDNRELREATLRSHVQIKRNFSANKVEKTVKDVASKLRALDNLWNRNIPDMIEAYFDDLRTIIAGVRDRMGRGGRIYMVVGDSKYGGVEVPVAAILTEMALGLSFQVVRSEPFRSMRSSPQQGGQPELAETLIVLEKK
jgi:DNA-binding transcriptional LysR family regulator